MKATVTADSVGRPRARFRLVLQEELARRCARNPQYSLRALAAALALDHSTLSQLLRGKRPFTERTIRAIGARLGLSSSEVDGHVEGERAFPSTVGDASREVRQLAQDTAVLIADWYHYAILELTRLSDFQPDTGWIARVLDIAPDDVNVALQRLIRLGLLEMAEPDRWVDRSGDAVANLEEFSQLAVQQLSAQVGRLAAASVHAVPAGYRDHGVVTFAVDSRRLPEAVERIARFRRDLLQWLAEGDDRDDVYQLEITLFPLTSLKKRKD